MSKCKTINILKRKTFGSINALLNTNFKPSLVHFEARIIDSAEKAQIYLLVGVVQRAFFVCIVLALNPNEEQLKSDPSTIYILLYIKRNQNKSRGPQNKAGPSSSGCRIINKSGLTSLCAAQTEKSGRGRAALC